MALRTVSYGGGVQSTALLVLAARGEINFDTFLFANTGDDSENEDTLAYLAAHASPYADAHGIALHTVRRVRRDGSDAPSLRQQVLSSARSIDIPVRMANGAPGNRNCTETYKIKPIAKWLKAHGATPANPATLAVGISVDEFHRSRTDSGYPYIVRAEPLIERRMAKQDCINVIVGAGLPVPPKSSCTFCPFQGRGQWRRQMLDKPGVFAANVALERAINEHRAAMGKDPVWLSAALIPLDMAIVDTGQMEMDFLDTLACDSGHCMR